VAVAAVGDRGKEGVVVGVTSDLVVALAADHVLDRNQRVGSGLGTASRACRKIDGAAADVSGDRS
jgi:hypothetical protein